MKIIYFVDKKIYLTKMSRVRFHGMSALSKIAEVTYWGINWPNYDNNIGYRTEEEFQKWKQKDPIPFYEERLLTGHILDKLAVKHIEDEIQAEIQAAFDFAENSPFPKPGSAFQGMFAEKAVP